MPNTTANFALPYPSGTDDPCEFAQQWCDFTDAVEAVLDGFQATIDRIYPMIRVAILRLSTDSTFPGGSGTPVFFDTVDVDTAGWTDQATMDRIIPDIGGFVKVAGTVTFHAKAVSQFQMNIARGPTSTLEFVNLFTDGNGAGFFTTVQSFAMSTFDYQYGFFQMKIDDTSANTDISLIQANLAVFWHSDV